MSLRDDILMRTIRQLVDALLKLRKKKDLPAAEQALGDGLGAIGLPLGLVATLDVNTLRGLVPADERRALVGAALVELARLRGDPALEERGQALLDDVDVAELDDEVREVLPE